MKIGIFFIILLLGVAALAVIGILTYFVYLIINGRGDEIPPPPGSSKAQFDDWFNQKNNDKR